MILILAARFRRHIALLLYGIFYGQFIMAAESLPLHQRYERVPGRQVGMHQYKGLTYYQPGDVAHTLPPHLLATPDSTVIPVSWKAPVQKGPTTGSIMPYIGLTPAKTQHSNAKTFIGGPSQPEMGAFKSVGDNNMVDLFSGDFSYNIPLLDVGGYPVNISYSSGRSTDEEASWVGLGWNVNPGSITRSMRGIPDDFSGGSDSIRKVASIKPNLTIGGNFGGNVELAGLPLNLGASIGVFHSTYNGWGMETGLNASINAGAKSSGPLAGGLSLTDNSQTGVTINPSLSAKLGTINAGNNGGASFGLQLSAPYNSRTGLKDIHMGVSANVATMAKNNKGVSREVSGGIEAAGITFAWSTYTPTITMPMTNYNFSFTAKVGGAATVLHPNLFLTGYVSREYIAAADTSLSLPAFGYLNYQNMGNNWAALTDFNREKEMPYREKPAIPHIAIPAYTYDVFSISGEGTGGMFRAYRGDVGFIADHLIKSKTITAGASIDFGAGNLVHAGVDVNANYSVTQSGPWLQDNFLSKSAAFQNSNGLFESAYFRNPAEKAINTTGFYNAIGGDDVVTDALYQPGNSGPTVQATNVLNRYSNKKQVGSVTLSPSTAIRNTRDKRAEVISYLTAKEASEAGLDKYINHYAVNQFGLRYCQNDAPEDAAGDGTGLLGYYFSNQQLTGQPVYTRLDPFIFHSWNTGSPFWNPGGSPEIRQDAKIMSGDHYSMRWLGRIKAPTTGTYTIGTYSDDGIRVWINDSLVINDWTVHGSKWDSCHLNLVAGKMYDFKMEYFENQGYARLYLSWQKPGDTKNILSQRDTLQTKYLYPPVFTDTFSVNPILTHEDRVNNFRKANHISEIDVLNPDGHRYVYGIPVYNLAQKEISFSVNKGNGDVQTGLTSYVEGQDNTTQNSNGKDGYFSKEEIPAYAHSFLLTGILSPDYVDITGDGISDDDLGDAVRFDYSKVSGIANPYGWRAPYVTGQANYNEGFKSYDRDDKAHYIFGTKELWYLHSIESKTMVANFTLQPRADLLSIDEHGTKYNDGKAMCLKQIDLYSKADYMQNGTNATPIKTVHFEYTYELCRGINQPINDSGKLTLKRIWFTYNGDDKGAENPYVFNYHPNNPDYKTNSSDKWGTYKDLSQNPGYTVSNPINNAEYPYSLQDSSLAAYNAGAWNLDSIQLPSGGRIKVNYESDDYAYVQNRRAAQMFKIAGFGKDSSGTYGNQLYDALFDHLYIYVKVPYAASSRQDLFARYLDGLDTMYFRLFIQMPSDDFGKGSEYVPAYASPDKASGHWYGIVNSGMIWIKLKGVNTTGDGDGVYSPLAQTAINFLRLNLPSKAYPGSEVQDNLNLSDAVKIVASLGGNILELLNGFTNTARGNNWVNQADTSRSFVRLNCPILKKYGGGLRVKSLLIYDHWNAMTGKKETVYGQQYDYTTTQTVNGISTVVSSGVASWEPSIGGEENPFHLPIEYVDRSSMLAPAATLYTEQPLGEAFFPSASVGYSKVRMRSIHTDKTRSANGYSETTFYTSYDFPASWDWSMLDNDTKKRYKPLLNNFLRINSMNYMNLSQGFKVELNDMNGKLHTEASYAETDPVHPVAYTENFYKVDDPAAQSKHLNNTVMTIDPAGNVDTAATIGKDAELMTDMREQTSTSIGGNINVNEDMFLAGAWPIIIPSLLSLYQKETTRFRSVAISKVIQRYGILDSTVHIDKGSKVSSENLLYDSETGDPLLVRTRNEFNDSLYQFTYPAHWAYKGVGRAYQNIDVQLSHLKLSGGKITEGLSLPDTTYLMAGDELLIYSKQTIGIAACQNTPASFSDNYKLWVIDTNAVHGGPQQLFLIDQYGIPFSGNDVTLKVTRSGHRNLNVSVGSVNSLSNPLVADAQGGYHLVFDTSTRVFSAGASELQQYWRVADKRRSDILTNCVYTQQDSALAAAEGCSCLKPFFDYLIANHLLFLPKIFHVTVGALVNQAINAGYPINTNACPILMNNAALPFYSLTPGPNSPIYEAKIGSEVIDIRNQSGLPMNIYQMTSSSCDAQGRPVYKNPGIVVPGPDTVTVRIYPNSSVNLLSAIGTSCPNYVDSLLQVDSVTDHLMVENSLPVNGFDRNAVSVLRFDSLGVVPYWANILSAKMILQADLRGHIPGLYDSANSITPVDSLGASLVAPAGWFPYQPLDTMLYEAYYTQWFGGAKNITPFHNDTIDVATYLTGYLNGQYGSDAFVLTQGSGRMHSHHYDSALIAKDIVPSYLTTGYSNYYSTFYSRKYADSTKWPAIVVTYVAPQPLIDTMGAVLEFNSTLACNTVYGRSCYSSVTDTMVNPYQYGILGDYRPVASYVYYGRRNQSNPAQPTNIRTDGVIKNFAPFWNLQSGRWLPSYDTSRWIWDVQTTLYNRKGFELENKDPLGRYNSGLYGYGLTLPTAVTQNGRYQETVYDGFEDYGYVADACDTLCPETRPFDFSPYAAHITATQAHTGLYSLRIGKDSTITMTANIMASTNESSPQLTDTLSSDTCLGTRFDGIKASANTILPSFAPFAGKKMLLSAWVKEEGSCSCQSYTRDHIQLNFTQTSGTSSVTLSPSGNMIEGWQRYESIVNIPLSATGLTLLLQASDSAVTYFDDIRFHPFNAEMKSYVYNPVNLRLMAEMDENNYAIFYEYDDEGTLIRVKKETERGIMTIKESRSALLKNQ